MKYIKLLRIHHYLKNCYVLLPIFFAGEIFNIPKLKSSIIAFIAFSFAASSIYILNDLKDVESDRLHPEKKSRPIPAGLIKVNEAIVFVCLLLAASLTIAYLISIKLLLVILLYFLLNVAYTYRLKNIAIVDVVIISLGFVLRVISGGVASDIKVSHWLIIMVFLLSMFQALAKRMDDLYLADSGNSQLRKSLAGYNTEFLHIVTSMLTGVMIVCYIMYIISPEITQRLGEYSYATTFFVLLGLLRYLQLTFVRKTSGSPVKVLMRDRFIQLSVMCWVLTFFVLIYIR